MQQAEWIYVGPFALSRAMYSLVADAPSYEWMRKMTAKPAVLLRNESQNKVSLVFQNLSPEDLAKHLGYIDYKACRRITVSLF